MKIVSIGNLSLGGTNKTPLTMYIGNYFLNNGYKIAIISRGYKGKIGLKTAIISDGKNIFFKPPLSSDEPYMMARNLKCPVITGKDRQKSLKIAEENFKTHLAVLDDAFQYKKIKKDVEILLLNHKNPLSTGIPFPFGYIREFPWAIRRADIIIFTGYTDKYVPAGVEKYIENKDIFYARMKPMIIENIATTVGLDSIKNLNIFAFCGIANPEGFVNHLKSLKPLKLYIKKFADHHYYTAHNIEWIKKKANDTKADLIITTEKDYVKLPQSFMSNIYYLKVTIEIDNEKRFFSKLEDRLFFKHIKRTSVQ